MSKKEIKPIECADCGHVLVEHYHLKSSEYGCIGNNGQCNCSSLLIK